MEAPGLTGLMALMHPESSYLNVILVKAFVKTQDQYCMYTKEDWSGNVEQRCGRLTGDWQRGG